MLKIIITRRSLGRAQSPTMNGLQYYNNLMGDLIEYNGGHLEFTKKTNIDIFQIVCHW